eukprot:Sspe_Gene.116615::Locus_106246_Transcript_1_1_Confidence_1.000_Length_1103::g.116615::m.116615/K16675/ZDHHC9_14_18; palmitoyltransferase ZDHHC9/14/18
MLVEGESRPATVPDRHTYDALPQPTDSSDATGPPPVFEPIASEGAEQPKCTHFCCLKFCSSTYPALGKARQLSCGKCVVTPYWYIGLITFQLHLISALALSIFTALHDSIPLLVVLWVLVIIPAAMMLLANCIDPGVVPRGKQLPTFPSHLPNKAPAYVAKTVNGLMISKDDWVVEDSDGLTVWRWCHTCRIHRPPRAAHCSNCDWCVEEFDHHCPVVGSCVARRTFRYFALFMWTSAVLAGFIFVVTIYLLFTRDGWETDSASDNLESIALIGCLLSSCFGGCWSGAMGSTYCNYACSDSTMRERERKLSTAGNEEGCTTCRKRIF